MKFKSVQINMKQLSYPGGGGGWGGRGGGGTLIFSAYVGSDPLSAKHPKKIFEILATQKNIPNSVP